MHFALGGYHPRDIQLVAAYDVDAEKVDCGAGNAISASNNTVCSWRSANSA